jgi:predicted DsbA family dithiol-disulfide isomerase
VTGAQKLTVEVWSDIVCPFCYVGKRNLERALADRPDRQHIEVRWRSFELDPGMPAEAVPADQELARRRGLTLDEARAMHEVTERQGAELGIPFDFRRALRGSTFDAHRVLHMAEAHSLQDAVNERLMAAYFTEGGAISDRATLADLAAECGLDGSEVRAMLESDRYAADVRADEQEAAALGINAVPFFVIDRRYALAGAHPPEVLSQTIERTFADRATTLS